ncbi:MAG: hypothetical protein EG823_03535 [Actinobacteria bacterium]|nr:hypothetical protein [Actinomycetota bacterium]
MRASAVRETLLRISLLLLAALLAVLVLGCESGESAGKVGEAVAPAQWDLSTPESAVRSYLDWVSFSYRMANSDIPSATMTPEEGVRVDSYIQLNRMEGKGIEQFLESFEVVSVTEEASSAVLVSREAWRYRYFSLESLKYLTDGLTASYDATYTLVAEPQGWLVDKVEATAEDEVQ